MLPWWIDGLIAVSGVAFLAFIVAAWNVLR